MSQWHRSKALLQDLALALQCFLRQKGHLIGLSVLFVRPLADHPQLILVLPPRTCHLLQEISLPGLHSTT